MAIKHYIPVADADMSPIAEASRTPFHPSGNDEAGSNGRMSFFTLLIWFNIFCFLGIFTTNGGGLQTLAVVLRFLLWPLILFGATLHIMVKGANSVGRNMLPVMPFFAVGLVSAMFGYDMFSSLRMLTFWFLGIVSASVIGVEVPVAKVQKTLFAIMFVLMGASIFLVLMVPGMAVGLDTRGPLGGGSWNGIFPSKNGLGWVAGYALVICAFVPRTSVIVRLVMAAATLICLVFSGSQGSVVIVMATAAFVAIVWFLRRTSLSVGARASVLMAIVMITIPVSMIGSSLALELLGRDATMTGRTDIWQAFLGRALNYWLIGAGPGSFTTGSSVTVDLSVALVKFGSIITPHNMFIAVFGETGIFGLIAYVSVLFYVAFVLPFRNERPIALATSAIAFMTAIGGIGETREVFGSAFAMFLLILMLSLTRKSADQDAPAHIPPPQAGRPPVNLVPEPRNRIPALG